MGEYFEWINVDKKEYISPYYFDLGNKFHESMYKDNDLLTALRDLMTNEWKGDRVIWLGDECFVPQGNVSEIFDILTNHIHEFGCNCYIADALDEIYKNVSGLFKAAEEYVHEEIEYYLENCNEGNTDMNNEFAIDPKDPYKNMFLRSGRTFKYAINYSKNVCYSFEDTEIIDQFKEKTDFLDPLPFLMGYGRTAEIGPWFGDIIGFSDSINEDIKILDLIRIEW